MEEKNEARYEELKSKIDKVRLSGFVRAKYDSDSGDKGVGSQNNGSMQNVVGYPNVVNS